MSFVLCPNKKILDPSFSNTLTSVVYIRMLEKVIMSILVKWGPNDMQIRQDGAPPHFHIAVRMSLIECYTEMNWQM
jgi:hypothetical protein